MESKDDIGTILLTRRVRDTRRSRRVCHFIFTTHCPDVPLWAAGLLQGSNTRAQALITGMERRDLNFKTFPSSSTPCNSRHAHCSRAIMSNPLAFLPTATAENFQISCYVYLSGLVVSFVAFIRQSSREMSWMPTCRLSHGIGV